MVRFSLGASPQEAKMASDRSLPEILRSRAWDDRQHRKLRELAAGHIEALQRRVEELEAALKPFADRANRYNEVPGIIRFDDSCELWQLEKNKGMEVDITVGDLRRARAALIQEQKKDG
jgi:hypothetical protein